MNSLEFIEKFSTLVVDTGSLKSIRESKAEDATTNPTLVLQSLHEPETAAIVDRTIKYGKLLQSVLLQLIAKSAEAPSSQFLDYNALSEELRAQFTPQDVSLVGEDLLSAIHEFDVLQNGSVAEDNKLAANLICEFTIDYFNVLIGCEILKYIPGKVSTEVAPKYSFDADGSIKKAQRLIALYERKGIDKERVLIKVAATWEGLEAARTLEKYGIHCNMTLIFSLAQAVVAANAAVSLISPFVGRIFDWYKVNEPELNTVGPNDPGVKSVKAIYNYYKKFGFKTTVMAASFRNISQIQELVGCDKLTISPKLLMELSETTNKDYDVKLSRETAMKENIETLDLNEKSFRWAMNEDKMASDKLAEGIRNFQKDYSSLVSFMMAKLYAS